MTTKKIVFLVSLLILLVITFFYIVMKGGYFTVVHDVAIESVAVSKSEVFVGDVANISVIVRNEGSVTETFNVTAYYNTTVIETQIVTDLAVDAEKTLTFSWNTTDISPSNYVIKAEASAVSGETDTADNTYTGDSLRVNRRTILYIDPSENVVLVSQNFTVNILISNVADLYGFEFKLRYNTTILDILNITEGNFLKKGGTTFFYKERNTAEGYIYVISTLLGPIPGVDGSGMLATITFKAIGNGVSIIDLYDTKLRDNQPRPISHITIDGSVEV